MKEIHPSAQIHALADLEESVRGSRLIIGQDSRIDAFVKIKFAGGLGDVVIGKNCYINSGCVIYSGHGVRIGDHVAIAANCTLAPVNHAYSEKNRRVNEQGFIPSKGGILIEDDVWIGANCVLLDGAILRRGCIIGASSLVRGEIPAYTVGGGNPYRIISHRT